jgi:hypothetical protein
MCQSHSATGVDPVPVLELTGIANDNILLRKGGERGAKPAS